MNSGIILIDKEIGWTSRDVDNKISGIFHTKKVGHIGTLDPFATGLLIVAINKATKIIPYLETGEKTYEVEMVLGKKTDTGDVTGNVIETKDVGNDINENTIINVFSSLLGEIEQVPPAFSAVKYQGKALYKYAREGIKIKAKPRKVTIKSIILNSFKDSTICYTVVVSKGTYIRSLSETIAEKLATVGFTKNLKRTKIINYNLNCAKKINEITYNDLQDISNCLTNMTVINVVGTNEFLSVHGQPLKLDCLDDIVLVRNATELIAIYEKQQDGVYHCKRGLI